MIDFKSMTDSDEDIVPINPLEIYEQLDRQSDKGDLRDTQKSVLSEWMEKYRDKEKMVYGVSWW